MQLKYFLKIMLDFRFLHYIISDVEFIEFKIHIITCTDLLRKVLALHLS